MRQVRAPAAWLTGWDASCMLLPEREPTSDSWRRGSAEARVTCCWAHRGDRCQLSPRDNGRAPRVILALFWNCQPSERGERARDTEPTGRATAAQKQVLCPPPVTWAQKTKSAHPVPPSLLVARKSWRWVWLVRFPPLPSVIVACVKVCCGH